ncbi:uncharacterized protein LOC133653467 isoform X2 [Entelurus aequoreus]|uniref:uncharacterized protein LOC133653467 isoform X2 n=1 Tax=Entelurus aequoreus TaxID=161455 RepID=UPI002B1E5DE2|nr:uncharacterized protein LOC133653467 isoform X2 [Entelurus aequoreus]
MSLTAASRLHESNLNLTNRSQKNNWVSFQTKCPPLPSPTLGTHVVLTGNGSHVGSMVSLLCPSKHKRVGVELTCVMAANKARWVGELHCTPLSVFEGNGFRVAALASIVSIGVIFIMSMLFITCCILDCIQKDARRRQQRRCEKEADGLEGLEKYASWWDIHVPDHVCDNSPPRRCTYSHGRTSTLPGFSWDQRLIATSDSDRISGPPPYGYVCTRSDHVPLPTREPGLPWQHHSCEL